MMLLSLFLFVAPLISGVNVPPLVPPAFEEHGNLLISVAVPAMNGKRTLTLGSTFPVVVTNITTRPARLWRDWCSWGYDNLSLEFADNNDQQWTSTKVPGSWYKNIPDAAELAPGESIIFTVKLDKETWKEFSRLAGLESVKMRMHYHISEDKESKKVQVWTGRLETGWQTYTVKQQKNNNLPVPQDNK